MKRLLIWVGGVITWPNLKFPEVRMQTDNHLRSSSWIWLLFLFSLASFMEASFYGQMGAFTPLYLPRLGISQTEVAVWTGRIVAISGLVGIPFLPFWGALADRYARQPVIVQSCARSSFTFWLLWSRCWRVISGYSWPAGR
jgi:MFS family permease